MCEDVGSEEEQCALPAPKARHQLLPRACAQMSLSHVCEGAHPVLQFICSAAEGRPYPLCAGFEDGT